MLENILTILFAFFIMGLYGLVMTLLIEFIEKEWENILKDEKE